LPERSGNEPSQELRVKIALLQATGAPGRTGANLVELERAAHRARTAGASVLVSPELFLTSYDPRSVADDDGNALRTAVATVAERSRIWLVASTVEHEGLRRFISASIFAPNGQEITRYRKRHLFGADERESFQPGGHAPEVVEIDGWRAALALCFDIEFPEFVRNVALRGAELLLVPTAVPLRPPVDGQPNPLDTRLIPRTVVPTRAFESQLYIAYANQCAPEFAGWSTIADPFGRHVHHAGDGAALVLGDISRHVLNEARRAVDYLDTVRRQGWADEPRSKVSPPATTSATSFATRSEQGTIPTLRTGSTR
jgi:predicted amidohydrolase